MGGASDDTQARRAHATLLSLLATPKTRAGLVAAVSGGSISKNFVFGWLTEQTRNGSVVVLKSTSTQMYQRVNTLHTEQPCAGSFPSWLETRTLPALSGRRIYIDGKLVNNNKNETD